MSVLSTAVAAATAATPPSALDMLFGYALKYGPTLVADVLVALKKNGITVSEVETIFQGVKSYESFGINPNAPVKPEPQSTN